MNGVNVLKRVPKRLLGLAVLTMMLVLGAGATLKPAEAAPTTHRVRVSFDWVQLRTQFGQQCPHQPRPLRRMDAEIVEHDDRNPPPRLRARHSPAHLSAERRGTTAVGQLPVEPARAPIDEAEAVAFGVRARRLHAALVTPAPSTPDARDGTSSSPSRR